MTVTKINESFEKIARFQIRYRLAFLIAITLVTVVGFFGLKNLVLEDETENWINKTETQKAHEEIFEDLFGNQDAVAVLVQAENVFEPEILSVIERLSSRLENEVPFADEVTSLTRLSVSMGTEDGIQIVNPFEEGIPGNGKSLSIMTEEEKTLLEEKRAFVMSRESLVNNIVSDDQKETWVILSLLPFSKENEREEMYSVGKAAINVVESEEFKSSKYTLKGTGMSYTETEEQEVVSKETSARVASGFLVMLLCLVIFVRSLRGVIGPIIATIGGIGSVLGYSAHLGFQGEATLVTLPILLGMALSVGYAVHYINGFRNEIREVASRKEASIQALKTTGWPILFTVITTMASFVSFMGVGINSLKWVGGISSCIVFAVYLYTVVLLPILFSYGKNVTKAESEKQIQKEEKKKQSLRKTDLLYTRFGEWVIKSRLAIVIVSAVVTVVSFVGLLKLTVNMDYVSMMGKRIPYVARILSITEAKLGNQYSYDMMIEYPNEDAFKNPEAMLSLDNFAKDLGNLRSTKISGNKARVSSVCEIVKEMNRTLNSDLENFYTIPEDDEYLAQLLFLYEISGGENLSNYISDDYTTARVHVEMSGYDANKIAADKRDALNLAEKYFPGAKVSCIGTAISMAEMNQVLVNGELKSVFGSFAIILVILIIAFSSIRAGLIAMLPNITPVLLVGGIMGICKFPLDMLTMTIMPMVLGIAVDDTIHFTNHVKYEFELTHNYHEAIINSFVKIARSMLATTIILCTMFFMYMFSPIAMLSKVGLLAIVGLASALVADYTLTPALLYMIKPIGKEKQESANGDF